jgi:hypothetical protein
MTLRDFFHERWASKIPSASTNGNGSLAIINRKADNWAHSIRGKLVSKIPSASTNGDSSPAIINHKSDNWARAYVDIRWLQPLCESFDDDASGFVTTDEVNSFTSSRPQEWRLVLFL